MNYIVTTKTFTRISETSGTIQNASRINAVEISNQAVKNTGVLLSPQEMFSFSDTTLSLASREYFGLLSRSDCDILFPEGILLFALARRWLTPLLSSVNHGSESVAVADDE